MRVCPDAESYVLPDVAPAGPLAGVSIKVTGRVNIAAKRNLGARLAEVEFLAFIDSDAFPIDGWLDNAQRHLDSNPDLGAVGGPNLAPPDQGLGARLVAAALRSVFVSGKWTFRKLIRPMRFVDDMPSCNLIVRRDAYLALGGMNENLFTGEDMEFCARLRESGRKILYVPDVQVYHENRRLWPFVLQRLSYGASVPDLLRKRFSVNFLALALPALFLLFLASWPLGLLWPKWMALYAVVVGVYVFAIVIEAIRHASRIADTPGVMLALILGNLVPGLGTIAQLCGLIGDRRKVYRNDG